MKMQESGFPHFFVTTKGLVSNPENKISTKNERGQLRQRCSPTVCEKKKYGPKREEGGGGWGENKIGGRKEGWKVSRKDPKNERKKMKK